MRTVLWRRFRIDYTNSNRIAGFRQGKEFSHGLGHEEAFHAVRLNGRCRFLKAVLCCRRIGRADIWVGAKRLDAAVDLSRAGEQFTEVQRSRLAPRVRRQSLRAAWRHRSAARHRPRMQQPGPRRRCVPLGGLPACRREVDDRRCAFDRDLHCATLIAKDSTFSTPVVAPRITRR